MSIDSEKRYGTIDRTDYHFVSAQNVYCKVNNKNRNELCREDYDRIYLCAGNHIGFFVAWIFKHGFEGKIHSDNIEVIAKIKNEKMTGIEFLMNYCDGKFLGEDVSDEIFDFVNSYYIQYLVEYEEWADEEKEGMYSFVGTWEDYREIECIIDSAYEEYKK